MLSYLTLEQLHIIGIAIKTSNKDQQSAGDINGLWEKFWNENTGSKIPNKLNEDIYCVYTEYEGDFTQPYTTLIGYVVKDLNNIPVDMKGITIESGDYIKLTAKGKLSAGVVINEWSKVWQSDLPRNYKADFEVYGAKAVDPDNAEIDIFVGVKQ